MDFKTVLWTITHTVSRACPHNNENQLEIMKICYESPSYHNIPKTTKPLSHTHSLRVGMLLSTNKISLCKEGMPVVYNFAFSPYSSPGRRSNFPNEGIGERTAMYCSATSLLFPLSEPGFGYPRSFPWPHLHGDIICSLLLAGQVWLILEFVF